MYNKTKQEIVPMMISEEFTFPVINATNQAILPPLWRICSVNYDNEIEENGRKRRIFHRSFSEVEEEIRRKNEEETKADEEKMDLLWEDLNESDDDSSSVESGFDQYVSDCVQEFGELGGYGNVEIGKRSKKKKTNLVVVVKMLKKLFFVQI